MNIQFALLLNLHFRSTHGEEHGKGNYR